MNTIRSLFPGLLVSAVAGMAALFLSEHYQAPAMLFALLLGMALSFLYQDTQCKAGIEFSACHVLRIGVALLGLRIAFSDVETLGWQTLAMLVVAIFSTIGIGLLLSKVVGLNRNFGALTGGAVGICGASAALAISSILPNYQHKERDTLLTVIIVTALSTIAMVVYPIITAYLNMDDRHTGIFLGATIHDVAQVVGAGYSVNDDTGDLATLTKLVRVALLVPVVLCMLAVIRSRSKVTGSAPGVPAFLVAFVLLVLINNLFTLPTAIVAFGTELSRFALIVAITSIGMKSNLGQIRHAGLKPVMLVVAETLWIGVFALVYLYYN